MRVVDRRRKGAGGEGQRCLSRVEVTSPTHVPVFACFVLSCSEWLHVRSRRRREPPAAAAREAARRGARIAFGYYAGQDSDAWLIVFGIRFFRMDAESRQFRELHKFGSFMNVTILWQFTIFFSSVA